MHGKCVDVRIQCSTAINSSNEQSIGVIEGSLIAGETSAQDQIAGDYDNMGKHHDLSRTE